MSSPKRNRARILTASGLKKLREQIRSHEVEENDGFKYTLERLGELTGLDPETVKNVLDCKGSDKRTIARCFETFGLTLMDSDHIPAAQATFTADPNFVGRDEAIADLNALTSRNARVIVIQARGGVGKTTLARKYLQQEFGSFLEFPIAKETKDIASIEGLLEEKLRQLGEEAGREFLVSLDRLKRKLQAERIGILIDNLEPALDSAGKFIEAHRRYVELLRVLADPSVQSVTLITTRERLHEPSVTVQHYPLSNLGVTAWEAFFQLRQLASKIPAITALHHAYGGNAKAMEIVSSVIRGDYSGDIEYYWQANQDDLLIERDLEDLVIDQFNRLQQQDKDAYKLLCRMGCYRYQDVPRVPIEGLMYLLWDVPENQRRRVTKSLQERSLIDFENGEFWLHPVIRAEALSRLRSDEAWKTVNQKAAEFWTGSVEIIERIGDVLRALEAYYHYVEIHEFESAINLILKEKNNKWRRERLDVSLYRFGILQKVAPTIIKMENYIQPSPALCGLYHILGDLNALKGYTKKAIDFFKKSANLAEKLDLDLFKVMSCQNIGHCNLDFYELEEAERVYEETVLLTENTELHRYTVNAWCCLAFINSCKVSDNYKHSNFYREKAHSLANKSLEEMPTENVTTWGTLFDFCSLGLTYRNLGEIEKSFEMFNKALLFADECHYILAKAIALTGLATLEQNRKNWSAAFSRYVESIELLENIGAVPELAEAHYQRGLTYQAIGDLDKSITDFQESIRLFTEMEAPKQVERVRQSMQSHDEKLKMEL